MHSCWEILNILFTKSGSESDRTELESQLTRVSESDRGAIRREEKARRVHLICSTLHVLGSTWYAPPLAQSSLLLPFLASFELEGILWEILHMQQLLSNPTFLLTFLPLPVSFISIYPPPLKWNVHFINWLVTYYGAIEVQHCLLSAIWLSGGTLQKVQVSWIHLWWCSSSMTVNGWQGHQYSWLINCLISERQLKTLRKFLSTRKSRRRRLNICAVF